MNAYNVDELVAPKWLTEEFLQKVLSNHEKNDAIEIVTNEITPASMKGDHYASCMYRAKVVYRKSKDAKDTATRSLIIKTMPDENTQKNEMLKDYRLFESEISMYTKTLPEIQRILAEHGDDTVFGPQVLYSSLKPHKLIIFEDLCVKGYDCVRGRALRWEEYKAVFKKLAKLHAVSYMIGQSEQARMVNKYHDSVYSNNGLSESEMMAGGFKRFRRVLESDNELRAYLPQFKVPENDIFHGCRKIYDAFKNGEEGDIFVLNHGDFHARNIMYKLGEKEQVEDVLMVDFQLPCYGPANIDLTYATFLMFDAETRQKRRDEIWRFYFEHFIATLKMITFQGKLPEFKQLQMSSLKYADFAKFLIATLMPMFHMMFTATLEDLEGKDMNVDELISSSDALMFMFMNPLFLADLKVLLPEFLKRGYLD